MGAFSLSKENIMSHIGSCFCGAVKLEVIGSPEAMGYCHCSSCRSWSGGNRSCGELKRSLQQRGGIEAELVPQKRVCALPEVANPFLVFEELFEYEREALAARA